MIKIHYTPKQVCDKHLDKSFSKSPLKPRLVVENLKTKLTDEQYQIVEFQPYTKEDFKVAHYDTHINGVYEYNNEGAFMENDLPWSKELVNSLEYTNASIHSAIRSSILEPQYIHLSPTSGFHHARPHMGIGFCTFSGQVIASIKNYKEFGAVGAYIDLDSHFGNSIEDTRVFNPELNKCVPDWANFNPRQKNMYREYINELGSYLVFLEEKILNNECQYIVYCHGADSILGDDSGGGKVTLEQWHECTEIFWNWYNQLCTKLGKPFPVSLALFGGYRGSNFQYAVDAHVKDIMLGLELKTKF